MVGFIIAAALQAGYYLYVYLKVFRKKADVSATKNEPFSVIICARNEAENLTRNLPSICSQAYPSFEVIVVNDCSVDNSEEILVTLSKKYKNLRYTTIVEDLKFSHGKKLALTVGIKSAQNEWLVMIDADCMPDSAQWLQQISQAITDNTQIILGYGRYATKKGLLNNYLRYETATIALQYLSFAQIGQAYMGTGRNMAYRRSLFFAHKGFASHSHVMSGDDDLFVNEAATRTNTRIMLSPESFTVSEPKTTFASWAKQKKRHLTTWKYYKTRHKWLLGGELFSRGLLYTTAITGFVTMPASLVFPIVFGVRTLVMLTVQGVFFRRLNEKN